MSDELAAAWRLLREITERRKQRDLRLWATYRDSPFVRRVMGPPLHFNPEPMFGLREVWWPPSTVGPTGGDR